MTFGLLLIRLAVGVILAAHGTQKLFGWFGGWGIEGTGNAFAQMGFVPGRRSAILAGVAEAGSGLLLVLGAATPFAAAMAAGVMLVAIVGVHLKQGFFSTQGGYEFPMLLGVAALSLAFTGPGQASLDALLGLHAAGVEWGAGALLAAVVGGGAQLASRRPVAAQPQAQPGSA
jgi:putative oxidoreductase